MSQPTYVLVLTGNGDAVHLRTCTDNPRGANTYPWVWAHSKSLDEVRAHAAELKITPCVTCNPLGGAA